MRGKPKTNMLMMVVGRVVDPVGRAQVDRLIDPPATAHVAPDHCAKYSIVAPVLGGTLPLCADPPAEQPAYLVD